MPRGVPGELIVEGPLIGAGYHNNPEATRKSFIEWPQKGCKAYRTGDLGGFSNSDERFVHRLITYPNSQDDAG